MKQTEQYELNQWDPADRILREDFNADNIKLDAALGGLSTALASKAGRAEEFAQVDAETTVFTVVTFMLPIKPWNNWEYLTMAARFVHAPTAGSTLQLSFSGYNDFECTIPAENFAVVFCPRHDDAREVSGIILCREPVLFHLNCTYKAIKGITLRPLSGSVPSPAHFIVGTP